MKSPFDHTQFPRVAVVSALVRLQDAFLPHHPDLRTFHYPEAAPALQPVSDSSAISPLLTQTQIVASVAERRREISENATAIILKLAQHMASELQLSELVQQVPPKVVCSDYVMTKQEWSAGMEDGYYEISGTFFTCVTKTPNSRIDGRLRNMIGPVIHLDTTSLVEPTLLPYAEETIHYLQWLYQTPSSVIDRIIAWRAQYDQDPRLREVSVAAMKARKLPITFPLNADIDTTTTEGGVVLVENSPRHWNYPRSIDLEDGQSKGTFDNEYLASRVLYEAVAELLRLRFGISESSPMAEYFSAWQERGIAAWNKACCRAATPSEQHPPSARDDTDSVFACYRLFLELPWNDFVAELIKKNSGFSLADIHGSDQLASQGHSSFPADLSHFLGYALASELHSKRVFHGKAGIQDASLRFFSPLVSAIDRLMSMKELLD